MGEDNGGPVGRAVDAQQLRGRGTGRQCAEDGGLKEVGVGQRVVVCGGFRKDEQGEHIVG
ncbi:hypothetical protein [Streptomyces sp. SID5643]|uniref:hypothetical protein n=1 Tax=Streptomyces sp. SID5643 TaxID=2690307 RepID=UPI00136C741B|nr:hypothetical protein [Streptomyces sp. SID5643]MZF85149.1 hypothetical protein [Streptomyces sp. SID5643]